MREWLSIIIVLLILGILLDGIRRMRAYRKHTLRMSRDIQDDELDDMPNSDFPAGGARVVAYRDSTDAESITQNARKNYTASRQTKGSRNRIPEQVALNLDVPVPMLMDTLSDKNENSIDGSESYSESSETVPGYDFTGLGSNSDEPSLGSLDDLDGLDDMAPELDQEQLANYASEGDEDGFEEPLVPYKSPITQKQSVEAPQAETTVAKKSMFWNAEPEKVELKKVIKQEAKIQSEIRRPEPKKPEPKKPEPKKSQEQMKAPDMVLVINVMARRGEVFSGPGILDSFLANGLRYGDMDIFHRHESSDGKGKVLFSLANIVMPGTFELSEMDQFETPGFSMFLSLPIAGDSLGVYELMADTAQAIAHQLGGELKDEHRSVMTRQTIEHDRQRVIEYERKKRLERA